MNKEDIIKSIFFKIPLKESVSLGDFKKSLIHISVYEAQRQNKPGNSRYVFIGMYAFKGYLANLISRYISGNGKQLQHYLGNIFSNERLSKIFDDLNLEKVVTLHSNLKLESLKHIFVFAYLGFIYNYAKEDYLKDVALKYFINTSEVLLPKTHAINTIEILRAKANEVLGQKIKFLHTFAEFEGKIIYTSQIELSLTGLIAKHSSVSQLYAKKKVVKIALKYILDRESEMPHIKTLLEKKNLSIEEEKKRKKAEKEKKHKALLEEKRQKRELKKEKKRIEANEREIKRLLNKKGVKNNENLPKRNEKPKVEKYEIKNKNSAERKILQEKLK